MLQGRGRQRFGMSGVLLLLLSALARLQAERAMVQVVEPCAAR